MVLRPVADEDIAELARIRSTPEVYARWGGGPTVDDAPDVETYAIVYEDRVVGAIQWSEETEPDYRAFAQDRLGPAMAKVAERNHLIPPGGPTGNPMDVVEVHRLVRGR